MKIRDFYVEPSRDATLIGEDGTVIAKGRLSESSLLQLHLQVLQALLRGEDLPWNQVERPEDWPPLI